MGAYCYSAWSPCCVKDRTVQPQSKWDTKSISFKYYAKFIHWYFYSGEDSFQMKLVGVDPLSAQLTRMEFQWPFPNSWMHHSYGMPGMPFLMQCICRIPQVCSRLVVPCRPVIQPETHTSSSRLISHFPVGPKGLDASQMPMHPVCVGNQLPTANNLLSLSLSVFILFYFFIFRFFFVCSNFSQNVSYYFRSVTLAAINYFVCLVCIVSTLRDPELKVIAVRD